MDNHTSRRTKRPHKNRLTSRLLLLCGSVIIALVLAEYVTIPLYPQLTQNLPRRLFLTGFVAEPNAQILDVRTNAQGFTGPILEQKKPEGITRILTLGGSAMFNRRMTERLFEGLSAATSAEIQIQGGALKTHTSRSSVIKYTTHFSRYHFDYVLIYHAVNDLWANHFTPEDFQDDYSHLNPWYKRNLLLNHSVLARRVYNVLWSAPKPVDNGVQFRASQTFEQNIRELVRLIRNDGGTPILMTFGWYIPDNYTRARFLEGKLEYNNPTHYDECIVENWGPVSYVKEGLNRHNAIIQKISIEEHVLLLDQYRLLQNTSFYFGDFCHLSEEGTDVFIQHIVDFFLENQLLPPVD
jgi:hypothetical protein